MIEIIAYLGVQILTYLGIAVFSVVVTYWLLRER